MPLRWVERGAQGVARFPRRLKALVAFTADAIALPILLVAALVLRRGSFEQALAVPPLLFAFVPSVPVIVFYSLGMYRAVFRFAAHAGIFTATLGVIISTMLLVGLNETVLSGALRNQALAIFGILTLLYIVASRSIVRELLSFRRGAKTRVAIYGAGSAGAELVRSLRQGSRYVPVAFVDRDPALHGRSVAGIKVYSPLSLSTLVKRKRIASVLLAVPSSSRRERSAILKSFESLPVHVRTVPDVDDIVAGRAKLADLRDVDARDLLGRDPVPPNETLLSACVRDKVVMVTGAGGSIGSELCRQITTLQPRTLILIELSEHALYRIEREIVALATANGSKTQIVALLGNVTDKLRTTEIIRTYAVQTIYHAAAYKHVPIVEHNVIAGIRNNVLGTWRTAEAAIESGVETFVLVSTDKAVNPTGVMGASKRLAEMTLQALQERAATTRLCMVRFGNVLESSGSVVPLFREQIKRGGPVTVTHRDIIRYFMTIPEASQLVLQAGAMGKGGDVFVLDMGEPVRIVDLARRMVQLMGLSIKDDANADGDIEITYTGLRPAEKLYEELLIGQNVTGTDHPRIMRAMEHHLTWAQTKVILQELAEAADVLDCDRARELLMKAVAEYRPASSIQDLVWLRGQEGSRTNVTELRPRPRGYRETTQIPVAQ
jgi:FlaA1/EpsC-like NDP-sugar epimerase